MGFLIYAGKYQKDVFFDEETGDMMTTDPVEYDLIETFRKHYGHTCDHSEAELKKFEGICGAKTEQEMLKTIIDVLNGKIVINKR